MPLAHKAAANPDVASGTIVVAEEQTAGRGRLQRRWQTPYGQALLISVILKPPPLHLPPECLPMLAGIAVTRTVEDFAPSLADTVQIKWPNDILAGAEPETAAKVAGILIEAAYHHNEIVYAILGIGINANQAAADLPPSPAGAPAPTSLRLILGQPVDRTQLLIQLCRQLAAALTLCKSELYTAWRKRLLTLGRDVVVQFPSQPDQVSFAGRAVDVTSQGELVVQTTTGERRRVNAGDVSIRFPE